MGPTRNIRVHKTTGELSKVTSRTADPLEIKLERAKRSGQPIQQTDAPIAYTGDDIPFGMDVRQDKWDELIRLTESQDAKAPRKDVEEMITQAAGNTEGKEESDAN